MVSCLNKTFNKNKKNVTGIKYGVRSENIRSEIPKNSHASKTKSGAYVNCAFQNTLKKSHFGMVFHIFKCRSQTLAC